MCDPADETYRRTVHVQLTVQESRHRLARRIFHRLRGEIRKRYREGQEDQLAALGLVLNAVVLWNTRYIDAALQALREQGYPVSDEDAARLSPLTDAHLNVHGRYTFTHPTDDGLRPLRDLTEAMEDLWVSLETQPSERLILFQQYLRSDPARWDDWLASVRRGLSDGGAASALAQG